MRFEWDDQKEQQNIKKHKVSFREAATVWTDPLALIAPDPLHSTEEEREWIIGQSYQRKLLMVVYTLRKGKTRIISARVATKRERENYAEGT
ncbi:BrnT family toxin [Crocosphaera sp.]|uniref:BrnT family toxin n=1 Tax=Crocosphaera sp. TaxID=2729996 RepID=UPI003F1E51BA|nr:BrnT family toxin [Crocosphaera sp.]